MPSQGRVVSDIGDDGWVRVEWDTGSRNSYRMGKNGKYDLKLADNIQFFDEEDKDDNSSEKGQFLFYFFVCFLIFLIYGTHDKA